MIRVDGIIGSDDDPELVDEIAAHEAAGTLETVVLDSADRHKSRLRVETDAGTDLGVLVDIPELAAGDVLVCDDDRAVVVAFESREAFVIDLPESSTPATTVELGHRIGNQHWDIAIEEQTVYVPVEADKAIIEDVLGPYLPADTKTWYETVDADRFVDEETTDHGHESDHHHSHESDHHHNHNHESGHTHDGGHQ